MKKINITLTILVSIVVLCSVLFGGFYAIRKYVFDVEKPYYATVIDAKWSVVALDSGEKVELSGILVPLNKTEINFFPQLVTASRDLLVGKKVKVELIERFRTGGPHKYDLVRLYLEDGTCVNTYLLENGLAFFSHGYYRDKEKEIEAEARAKKAKKGIWAKDLDLLYVGSKDWEGVHYPECPEVKEIKPKDRMEYYSRPVAVNWYRGWYPEGCPYCNEIRKTKPKELQ